MPHRHHVIDAQLSQHSTTDQFDEFDEFDKFRVSIDSEYCAPTSIFVFEHSVAILSTLLKSLTEERTSETYLQWPDFKPSLARAGTCGKSNVQY